MIIQRVFVFKFSFHQGVFRYSAHTYFSFQDFTADRRSCDRASSVRVTAPGQRPPYLLCSRRLRIELTALILF